MVALSCISSAEEVTNDDNDKLCGNIEVEKGFVLCFYCNCQSETSLKTKAKRLNLTA